MIGVFSATVMAIAPGIVVEMLTGVDTDTWGSKIATLEFTSLHAASEEALLFGWKACGWWVADWNCRPLQARIPSDHV